LGGCNAVNGINAVSGVSLATPAIECPLLEAEHA
jgi:hypothetical protein